MDYQVRVVEDHQLPRGIDWVIAREGESHHFLIKRSRFSLEGGLCELLEEAWRTRVAVEGAPPSRVPVGV